MHANLAPPLDWFSGAISDQFAANGWRAYRPGGCPTWRLKAVLKVLAEL